MNRRLMMAQQAQKRLPVDYTALKYITVKDPYIGVWFDTGIYADGYTGAKYKYSQSVFKPYGGYVLSGSGFPAFPFFRNYMGGEITVNRTKLHSIKRSYSAEIAYEFYVDKNGDVYLDDEFIISIGNEISGNPYESTVKFGTYFDDVNNAAYHLVGNIYYCQIFQKDEIVRDFVPCINPEGVAGMYDFVEGRFYRGVNGIFSAGEEV